MGVVSSRPDEGALYLRDQNRLTISSLVISTLRKRSSTTITPNTFPATKLVAMRPTGDTSPIEFVQDTEMTLPSGGPNFLLKLTNDDELTFTFTFVIRQAQQSTADGAVLLVDSQIAGLTFVYSSTPKEVENLVTREFHADPNLHKNAHVRLVGDYGTSGNAAMTFEWSWKWKPPKPVEDRGGGWRNSCSFVEYDQRAHRLLTLASFSFWVQNTSPFSDPCSPIPTLSIPLHLPPKIRVSSARSIDSRVSSNDHEEPLSPPAPAQDTALPPIVTQLPVVKETVKVDIACPRPSDDVTVADDGPVFRATIKALEQKTGNMRTQMKKVLRKAESVFTSQVEANEALSQFVETLREASVTNGNAVKPAVEHYFDKISREIILYERQNVVNIQKMIIEPLARLYAFDIKQAELKKREFEEESKDYYAYVSRYLGQRHDSVKAKKLAESDSKYQNKRRTFELKRFDYSSFVQDLHGGRKEQEVLSHLTKYADAQTKGFLDTAKRVENLVPQLEALIAEVQEADKEYQYQRREREEKRRLLEKGNVANAEDALSHAAGSNGATVAAGGEAEYPRINSAAGSALRNIPVGVTTPVTATAAEISRSPGSFSSSASPVQASKFRGIRDLEERDLSQMMMSGGQTATQRKEGLLWSTRIPGSHVDPRNLNKQMHKFWIVLDQGKLLEYSNWKQKLDLNTDPVDLRMASVREARDSDRRFCFEVITPNFKRVYQATSEEDMHSWISAINNALQSAVEGRGFRERPPAVQADSVLGRDIGSILTGKPPPSTYSTSASSIPSRRITVAGASRSTARQGSISSIAADDRPDRLLQMLRENDQGNCWCADCGSSSKVEWVSINLAIILCIECSGIHRSLGTHISKVRSLTLDITSFTPDIVELLMVVGNRVANMVWEAKLEPKDKPAAHVSRDQRLRFITSKYVERAFVEPIDKSKSADELLLEGIKKNEIRQVIHGLALGAKPNIADKSRSTHAVFLALAAADPAVPSAAVPVVGSAAAVDAVCDSAGTSQPKAVPFPVAELLIQNGATLPEGMPAFPLGSSALQYVESKRIRAAALENVSGLPPAHVESVAMLRDKESRLQKRVSTGGRLSRTPIYER